MRLGQQVWGQLLQLLLEAVGLTAAADVLFEGPQSQPTLPGLFQRPHPRVECWIDVLDVEERGRCYALQEVPGKVGHRVEPKVPALQHPTRDDGTRVAVAAAAEQLPQVGAVAQAAQLPCTDPHATASTSVVLLRQLQLALEFRLNAEDDLLTRRRPLGIATKAQLVCGVLLLLLIR
uniref:Putative secreted protein n=1 Tax=Ixodes ricinus TaxID=34613 RepID=A0A6B0UYN9_IXORI